MASHFIIFLTLSNLLFILPSTLAKPAPAGPINVTDILVKGEQYTTFLRLLNQTRVLDQLVNQLNNSYEGMTLLAPTDDAFLNLPRGTINGLNEEEQVKLVLFHVLPTYYSLDDLDTISNPVRTQAASSHGSLGLNFTGRRNQVNVSSGVVETQINDALRQEFPFAVYSIDKVLLPSNDIHAPTRSSSTPAGKPVKRSSAPAPVSSFLAPTGKPAKGPSALAPESSYPIPTEKPEKGASGPTPMSSSSTPAGKPAKGPSAPAESPTNNGGGKRMDMGVGFVGNVVLFCMAFL
ncbi:fasciclin-like arabinogalactan protein 9 [Rutidosis leptorrhynchoides]|uniref:fasciclin-like arabinogalactan protein 9 n=1 Tax=Rutidosis leptorrhynchoides TaxID=125765 RepID=UPI003A998D96